MHGNSGYPGEAAPLARRFVDVFAGYDAVVTPSGSCAAQVRAHFPGLLGGADPDGVAGADAGSSRSSSPASSASRTSARPSRARWPTTRPATRCGCSSVGDAPLRLLRAVPGLELWTSRGREECCGFGGTFAVKNADVSTAMLDEKLAAIVATRRRAVSARATARA